ncbi:MBL fold metallo-hydrolase [Thermosipho ferrireducens]|uniref:MBL fold metallo-hydrolase n=1 Tax=Thermosipho ferrireducens TaxID=2571116 RepID=A0ABX7S6C1_9BACT|nr:MBL fold metallo-hydrolase [Thermosipho ferrireducens]QTA38128.1 MBL fold metallo-hydrolase [Thermosipho ferrireducens]
MSQVSTITLFEKGEYKFYLLGWEEKEEEGIVQTNQYLIVNKGKGILLDPGGAHVFPRVLANVSEVISPKDIELIFYTHQDPDVTSGISMWLTIAKNAKIYISELWIRFLPHFGVFDLKRIIGLKGHEQKISGNSGATFEIIPAHFMHSPGNFSVYDPTSRILFSGDIGAAVFPKGKRKQIIEDDFKEHLKYMEGFHKRYMVSNIVCKKWVEIVSKRPIDMIAPQHGAVMKGIAANNFLEWLKNLKCGIDILGEIYGS